VVNAWKPILAAVVIFAAGVVTGGFVVDFGASKPPRTFPRERGPRNAELISNGFLVHFGHSNNFDRRRAIGRECSSIGGMARIRIRAVSKICNIMQILLTKVELRANLSPG